MFKYIIIEDLGRNLNPIGINFKSPILKPSRFSTEIIGRLLSESRVTRMFEVYEQDPTFKVQLNSTNYTTEFLTLWKEANPDKVFPWENTMTEVITPRPLVDVDTSLVEDSGMGLDLVDALTSDIVEIPSVEVVIPVGVVEDQPVEEIVEDVIVEQPAEVVEEIVEQPVDEIVEAVVEEQPVGVTTMVEEPVAVKVSTAVNTNKQPRNNRR